jgi:hypothetical protein
VEVFIKVCGCDNKPWMYFTSNWNKFDFTIVACSWVPAFMIWSRADVSSGVSALKLLRLLRLFRLMRVIKFLPELKVPWRWRVY